MDIFFLPPIYLAVIIVSGVIVGLIFDKLIPSDRLISAGLIYLSFATGQLIFRVILNDEPARFIGQILYYALFLTTVYLVKYTKDKLQPIGE